MYTYVKSVALPRADGSSWLDVNLAENTFEEIVAAYRDVIFTFNNPALGGTIHSKLGDLLSFGVRMDITLNMWLAFIGDLYFPVTNDPYEILTDFVRSRDAIAAGYRWDHVSPISPADDLPLSERTDLRLSKTGLDVSFFMNNALVTVNGYLHRTRFYNGNIHIVDGGKTMVTMGLEQMSVMNMACMGPIQQVPIVESMLSEYVPGKGYRNGILVELNRDLTDKSVLISVAGCLQGADGTLTIINAEKGTVLVDLSRVELVERLMEQMKDLSLLRLLVKQNTANPDNLWVEQFEENEFFEILLTCVQSFMIVCDKVNVYRKVIPMEWAGFPGTFYKYSELLRPVLTATGRLTEPKVVNERGVRVVHILPRTRYMREFITTEWQDRPYVTPSRDINPQRGQPVAMELELGVQTVKWDT